MYRCCETIFRLESCIDGDGRVAYNHVWFPISPKHVCARDSIALGSEAPATILLPCDYENINMPKTLSNNFLFSPEFPF